MLMEASQLTRPRRQNLRARLPPSCSRADMPVTSTSREQAGEHAEHEGSTRAPEQCEPNCKVQCDEAGIEDKYDTDGRVTRYGNSSS